MTMDLTRADIDRLDAMLSRQDAKLDRILERLVRVESKQLSPEARLATCPLRIDVAQHANSIKRLERLEVYVDEMRITWAKLAGASVVAGVLGGTAGPALWSALERLFS